MRMASFRRSLSPMATADRSIPTPFAYNGDTDGAAASSHKYSSPSSSPSSSAMNSPFSSSATSVSASLLATTAHMRTLLFSNYPQKPGRAGEKSRPRLLQQQQIWKRPVAQFLLCFLIGFLLGFTPFCSDTFSPNLELKQQQQQQQQQPSVLEMNSATSNTVDTEPVKILKKNTVEYSNVLDHSSMALKIYDFVPQKLLIVVTPTYNRPFQALYLNRVAHTLKLVQPPLLWIVVEMNDQSMETAELLRRSGVMYRHLVYEKNSTDTKDRGTHQRNIALAHIEHHRLDGIVYFADDDNVYTLELFQQMRKIRRFGTWPVGMLAQSKNKAILEGPVCDRGQVIGWHTNEKSKRLRRFHVDMSGFAFNSTILWEPQRWGRRTTQPIRQLDTIKEGFQETTFIEQLVEDEYQMQGVPENCSKIMVWHLHLEAPGLAYPPGWIINKNLDVVVPVERSMVRIF